MLNFFSRNVVGFKIKLYICGNCLTKIIVL